MASPSPSPASPWCPRARSSSRSPARARRRPGRPPWATRRTTGPSHYRGARDHEPHPRRHAVPRAGRASARRDGRRLDVDHRRGHRAAGRTRRLGRARRGDHGAGHARRDRLRHVAARAGRHPRRAARHGVRRRPHAGASDPGARELVEELAARGWPLGLVSGGFVEVVAPLAATLGITMIRANALEVVDGTLTGRVEGPVVDRAAKAETLREYAARVGVPLARTIAIGDGANDLDMLAAAGFGIAFNAKPVVEAAADAAVRDRLDAVLDLDVFAL
ncbi:HAD-IB family phosphatase [Cellulomonas soli]